MPFGLTIGTERATALQKSIQDELTKRGYSPDADPVMAEYITIMIINNKTPAQVTGELEDLIGSDYDASFTNWLFAEAAKGAPESEAPAPPEPSTSVQPPQTPARETPPHTSPEPTRRPPTGPRTALYQQAINQVLPGPSSAQKRTASARSPSPTGQGPAKSRRTDLPTGPRAMQQRENNGGSRSLLERVGGPARNNNNFPRDDIQARIDNITGGSGDPNMMMPGGFVGPVGMGPMDMNAGMSMANPMMLQEMMMNQMAMMAQMASSMGIGQFGPGFVPNEMGMFPGGFQGNMPPGNVGNGTRGRGGSRGGRGMGRGRGGQPSLNGSHTSNGEMSAPVTDSEPVASIATPVSTSAPVANEAIPSAATASTSLAPQTRLGYTPPERPQSPTLCKFSLKCTNPLCRWSHPSPVATVESGVVLSNEACEKGKDCKDKDCIKAHVSPAVLNPSLAEPSKPAVVVAPAVPLHVPNVSGVPCKFGTACTRPNCAYSHPSLAPVYNKNNHFAQQCRFGSGCTRVTCQFQHPEGRVLPSTFHRGLSTNAPMVSVSTPETGSMGASSSHNRSMTFNRDTKEKLEKRMKEIEAKKLQAEKAVAEAEAAANNKKDGPSKPVAITA